MPNARVMRPRIVVTLGYSLVCSASSTCPLRASAQSCTLHPLCTLQRVLYNSNALLMHIGSAGIALQYIPTAGITLQYVGVLICAPPAPCSYAVWSMRAVRALPLATLVQQSHLTR